jgi:16S rRNA (cytidine1402-2'-O)-methyltransferase
LSLADGVLAEDTRRAGLLLAACGLKGSRFIPLHEHNEEESLPAILEELSQGRKLALVSDAGTPLLSDPGYKLVRACRLRGYKVTPLPGPCAVPVALCASGLPPQPFIFLGFPPRRAGEREKFFSPFASLPLTLVFFERKDRLRGLLEQLYRWGGPREICLARELTKVHEEFIFFTLGDFGSFPENLLGEITVVAGPPLEKPRLEKEKVLALIAGARQAGREELKPRSLVRRIQEQAPGWDSRSIYKLLQRE